MYMYVPPTSSNEEEIEDFYTLPYQGAISC